jgi:DNA polymerase IIIc chi subunit
MAIEWKYLEQKRFDRIVESMIHRMYSETARVEVVDGRGGDGGRDIVVTQGSRARIFQLNFSLRVSPRNFVPDDARSKSPSREQWSTIRMSGLW